MSTHAAAWIRSQTTASHFSFAGCPAVSQHHIPMMQEWQYDVIQPPGHTAGREGATIAPHHVFK
jgi:hypothetical protein